MSLLLLSAAHALTLPEVVERAVEADPAAVVAALEWRRARYEAAETAFSAGVSAQLGVDRVWSGGKAVNDSALQASVPLFDPGLWLDAAQDAAVARQIGSEADAVALDAQAIAAGMFYEVLAAEAGLEAAREGLALAEATLRATTARVTAGMESELVARSAQLGLLTAQAEVAQAEARLEIARATLTRLIDAEVGALEPAPLPELPADPSASPWLRARAQAVTAAKLGHLERLAQILPVADLSVSTEFVPFPDAPPLPDWTVALGATWSFDGLVGPFLRERQARIDLRIAEAWEDGTRRDLELALTTARAQARAADRVAEAATAREALAEESLRIGQTRLEVGLASPIEVLRLQDDAADARADRVEAELARALTRIEARRVAGLPPA